MRMFKQVWFHLRCRPVEGEEGEKLLPSKNMKEWIEVRLYPSLAAWAWPAPLSPGGIISLLHPGGWASAPFSLARSILHVMRRLLCGSPQKPSGCCLRAHWRREQGERPQAARLKVGPLLLLSFLSFFFFLLVRTPQEGSQVPWRECQCSAVPGLRPHARCVSTPEEWCSLHVYGPLGPRS